MVEGPGRPLFGWDFRAGQYLTIWAWNQVKQPVAPDAAVSQTSDISHIHSTETAHFSPLRLCTSETWQMHPHSCTQNTNTRFPLCACAHTHMKSQIRASHLFLYVIKTAVKVFSSPNQCNIDYVEIYLGRHMLLFHWNHPHCATFYCLIWQILSSLWHQTGQRLLIVITKFHWSQVFKRSWQAVKAWPHQNPTCLCWEVTENK